MGAAARAMSNFGFLHLRVVNPYEESFREARSAVGASELLARAERFETVRDAVADCSLVVGTTAARDRELQHPVHRLEAGAEIIRSQMLSGNVALLFGSEKRGLSNDDLSYCHWVMRIPTRDEHVSMNLGQAVAVSLYELVRSESAPIPQHTTELAEGVNLDRITDTLLESLQLSGYVKPGTDSATEEKVRRMVRRLHLDSSDAEVWLGMLRKMLWKMK